MELLEVFKTRYEKLNPDLNALVSERFKHALEEAKIADKDLEKGKSRGPLHGVPITIKDNLEVKGFPCTAGSEDFKNHISKKSADVVLSLKKAGAIVFAKSNLPRFGEDFQTYNDLYGTTNNPWDTTKTPGGSSGGAAAAVAAGMTSFEIGNDIGGSIRHPANFCGVYGHKPTFGIVPKRGIIPPPPGIFTGDYTLPADILVNGPIARAPEDLDQIMDLIVQPEADNRKAWKIKLPAPKKKNLKEYKVGIWLDDPACPVDTRVLNRIQRVVDSIANAGAQIEDRRPEVEFARAFKVFTTLLNSFMSAGTPQKLYDQWVEKEKELGSDKDDYQTEFIKASILRHRNWRLLDAERQILRQKWAEYFEKFDVLLCPVTPVTAFDHDHGSWFKRTIEVNGKALPYSNLLGWAGLTNSVYLPSTVAPIGISSNGLPIGIQIVAPYLGDKTSIHFAKLLKELVGGFTPPPSCL